MNPGGKNVPKYLTFLRLAWTKASQKSLKIAAGMFVQGLRLGWEGLGWGAEGGGAGGLWGCWAGLGELGGFCALLNIPPALLGSGSSKGSPENGDNH